MKKLFALIFIIIIVISSPARVNAADSLAEDYGADSLIDNLPEDTRKSLTDIGLGEFDINALNELSFEKILNGIISSAGEEGKTPLRTLAVIIALLLLYSLLYGLRSSVSNTSLQQVLSICVTLCVTAALVVPIITVINSGIDIIKTASDFMLAYIPVMLVVMTASGKAVSGASYYTLMMFAGQAVTQISSAFIAPFLKLFLGLSISSAVSPNINLSGLVRFISKLIKWSLGFIMCLFTGVLTLRQIVSSGLDSVGTRAVKFTLSSLVPVVGSALSEAYKTVQSSVGLLRSGVGVFALIAVMAVFMPVIIRCLWWLLILWVSRSAGELMGLKEPCFLLESVSGVIGNIFAIILCVSAVFIISTASVLILGGG